MRLQPKTFTSYSLDDNEQNKPKLLSDVSSPLREYIGEVAVNWNIVKFLHLHCSVNPSPLQKITFCDCDRLGKLSERRKES